MSLSIISNSITIATVKNLADEVHHGQQEERCKMGDGAGGGAILIKSFSKLSTESKAFDSFSLFIDYLLIFGPLFLSLSFP